MKILWICCILIVPYLVSEAEASDDDVASNITEWRKTIPHEPVSPDGLFAHTLEMFNSSAPNCVVFKMTSNMRKKIVDLHNKMRRTVAKGHATEGLPGPQPKAKNLYRLSYSLDLERVAMVWASQCVAARDEYRDIGGFRTIGQNFYAKVNTHPARAYWKDVVREWYSQVAYFDGSAAVQRFTGYNQRTSADISSYAQLVYSRTSLVGCAAAVLVDDQVDNPWYKTVAFCNYGEGAKLNMPLYAEGEPCVHDGSRCDDGLLIPF